VTSQAIGIDIGGTGIKGAVVDLDSGELLCPRIKIPTPDGGRPRDILATTRRLLADIEPGASEHTGTLGVCFPAVVKNGHTLSAANVSDEWIGLPAEALFEEELGRGIRFTNDADAAGHAEVHYGAARGVKGLVILTTLGTGIGSALLYDGTLIPNAELGHLQMDGTDAEKLASYGAKAKEDLDWDQWAKRLQKYYSMLEFLFSPDLFVVGGGVSKNAHDFLPLLSLKTPIIPAVHLNNAGIIGAASLAAPLSSD